MSLCFLVPADQFAILRAISGLNVFQPVGWSPCDVVK